VSENTQLQQTMQITAD